MSTNTTTEQTTSEETDTAADIETLRGRIAILEEKNERLRNEYVRAKQVQYRRTALGLAGVGLVAVGGSAIFPSVRDVLLVLGAIGLFGGLLTYYLTPDRFLTASTADAIYDALAQNGSLLVSELGLQDERIYVPSAGTGTRDARLFIPQHREYQIPDSLETLFTVTAEDRERGLAVTPTGAMLLSAFEDALAGSLASTPAELATQVRDGLVEQFELVETVETDVDKEASRLTISIAGSPIDAAARFDHPVASFVAVTIAEGLEKPVRVTVHQVDDRPGVDFAVSCEWAFDQSVDDD